MISPKALSIPTVLKVTPTVLMISPRHSRYSRDIPHGTQDIPTCIMISLHGTDHPLPPRYCTHIIHGDNDHFRHLRCPANCQNFLHGLTRGLLSLVLGQNPPGQNPPGQNPPDKIPLDKIPPRTKSPRTKSPWTKSPHYISPNCSIAQYFLLYINVIFEGQFSFTFVRCDILYGHEVEKRS